MNDENRKTILLVEDEAIIAMTEKMSLEKYGYSVITVTTGEKAVETVKSTPGIDIILMDIDLGKGIDGTEAAEIILKERDIPLLFVSSHKETEIVSKTEKITYYGYVVKSSSITVFDASIKMAFKLFEEKQKVHQKQMELEAINEKLKAKNEELIKMEKMHHETEEFGKIGGWERDFEKDLEIWTNGTFHIFELDPKNGVPKFPKPLEYIVPPFRQMAEEAIKRAIENGEPYDQEWKIITEKGNIRWIHSIAKPYQVQGKTQKVLGSFQDITERKLAEAEIQKQLAEKDILLREVYHRVKNNITNIESFLQLQADSIANPEAKKALLDAVSRVQSIRILYDKLLFTEDYHDVSIKSYTENLVDSLLAFYVLKNNLSIEKNISEFILSSKQAFSIGIIINELLTNAFKHAFKDFDKGNVSLSIEKKENIVTIIIQDNGIGIDERIMENKSPGFGLSIVKMLVEQLNGTYSIVNKNGTKSTVQFEI